MSRAVPGEPIERSRPGSTSHARLVRDRVIAKLREQARKALVGFVQALLDDPLNYALLAEFSDKQALARKLWAEALVVLHRLLFIFKLESSPHRAHLEDCTSSGVWRAAYALSQGLAPMVRAHIGMLFGSSSTPILDRLAWNEHAVVELLDRLLWMPEGETRERMDYGRLQVEDLGHVHEWLLELEPGIAEEPMCRLRRRRLEVVVPLAQAERYRSAPKARAHGTRERSAAERKTRGRQRTAIAWAEDIPGGSFYLRAGFGRRATGSYYTPHALVRFLIQETLGPQVAECSPASDPRPHSILRLKVLDPAMGAGHFLVEACRFLGEKLYEACRLCDAQGMQSRLEELPVPMGELLAHLSSRTPRDPSRAPAADKALLLCRRMVAAHCLYGIDKNPLAVELAKMSVWLEAQAGGLPLTFLDRHLVCGDSLSGSFFAEAADGDPDLSEGFDAVVGNPPWDAVRRNDNEFFAAYDVSILDMPTKAEKKRTIERLLKRPEVSDAYGKYIGKLEAKNQMADALYRVHAARVNGNLAGRGTYDDYLLFGERAAQFAQPRTGMIGLLLPSAFHGSEGGVGLRRLFLDDLNLRKCFSYENHDKLFEIDSRFKFAIVVAARRPVPTQSFECAFYLRDLDWLFHGGTPIRYTRDFVEKTGGAHLTFLELRSDRDVPVTEQCFENGEKFGELRARLQITLSQEVNMTYDSGRFSATSRVLPGGDDPRDPATTQSLLKQSHVTLHEGKTFHQYTDRWEGRPRYLIRCTKLADKPGWLRAARHFRLAFRDIARSTDERTAIACMLPPGVLAGNTATCEREPALRPTATALVLLACANSHPFDWILRRKNATHVSLFILDGCPVPRCAFDEPRAAFLAHSALRLTCNHEGYAPLWNEQVGLVWHEPKPVRTWPVVEGEAARWVVRAAIDAVVAHSYGLERDQYAHMLSSFSHKRFFAAPELCLLAFDELEQQGLEAFIKAHDPYWHIPLNESLAEPVAAP